MNISPNSLITIQTADKILSMGLEIAAALGLPVTTWQTGDPTRAGFKFLAEVLAEREEASAAFVRSAFLSTASGDWLKLLAVELYGVEVPEASFATPTITLTNTGGGNFLLPVGALSVRNSETDKTYHNTEEVTITPGLASITIDLVADEAGSDSSVGVGEIDEIVTSLIGVEVVTNTVGLANDAPSDEEIRKLCRTSLGPLSPNGPADAYTHVALNPAYTGVTGINRARAAGSSTGAVTITIATVSGPADGAAVAAVQQAVELWATPLCSDPTVVSAAAATVNIEVTIYRLSSLLASEDDITEGIESAIGALFAATPIGGVDGEIAVSAQSSAIHNAFPNQIYRVEGLEDIELASDEVPVLGTLSVVVL